KKKIATAGLPFTLPDGDALAARVDVATQAIYLSFTAGYAPGFGDAVVRADLAGEAIRLARLLAGLLQRRGAAAPSARALLALTRRRDRGGRRAVGLAAERADRRRRGGTAAGRHRGPVRDLAAPGRDRLGSDRRRLRPPGADHRFARGAAEPGGRGRRGGRPA